VAPTPEQLAFGYPERPHERRHGPAGYADDSLHKPFLRDDFGYRCVYCLMREGWGSAGHAGFSVEHLLPRSRQRGELPAEY